LAGLSVLLKSQNAMTGRTNDNNASAMLIIKKGRPPSFAGAQSNKLKTGWLTTPSGCSLKSLPALTRLLFHLINY
jgi:hypothetical protein